MTGATLKPLRRPTAPFPDESARSLFVRALAAHGVARSWTILRHVGGIHRNRTDISENTNFDGAALARTIRVAREEIEERRYPHVGGRARSFFGLTVPVSSIETRIRRFSPGSFARKPYARALWELRSLPFCRESWEMLVDACVCGVRQGWVRINGVDRCDDCGRPLAQVPVESVPTDYRPALSLPALLADPVAGCRADGMALLPVALREVDRSSVFGVIMRVRRAVAPPGVDITADLRALHAASEAVLRWPEGLSEISASSRFSEHTWRMIRRAYDGLAPTMRPARRSARVMGIRPAGERAGLTPETLLRARKAGHLSSQLRRRGDREVPVFLAEELDPFAEAYRSRIPHDAVAFRLGVSAHGVEQLAAMKLMPALAPALDGEGPCFTPNDLGAFSTRIAAGSVETDPNAVLLRTALAVLHGRTKPWGPIVDAMLAGALPYALLEGRMPLFDRIAIPRSSFPVLSSLRFDPSGFPESRFSDRMVKRDALETLNAGSRSDATNGLRAQGRNPLTFAVRDVEELAASAIAMLEFSFSTGLDPARAYWLLRREEVADLGNGLWDRKQAERILALRRRTGSAVSGGAQAIPA